MPTARRTLNAFTAEEMEQITGLTVHMINYLRRLNILSPTYRTGSSKSKGKRRGKIRYYSYRDLVAARLAQKLHDEGVQLQKLKEAIKRVCKEAPWAQEGDAGSQLRYLVSNGNGVAWQSEDGFLDTFRSDGQRAFSFVVNLRNLEGEVKKLVPSSKRDNFSMTNSPLIFEPKDDPPAVRPKRKRAGA